jgi:hypothetical protein
MRGVLPLLLATVVAGCNSSKTPEPAKVPLNEAPAMAPGAAPAGAAMETAPAGALAGPVIEALDAAPYIYLKVKTAQGEVWAAVPQAKVQKGAMVRVYNPMLMTKFESKSLKRTFDEVYFGTLTPDASDANANGAGPAPAMGGTPVAGAAAAGTNPHTGAPAAAEAVKVGKVEKATGADAKTVAEAWAQKDALAGKTITIRGTVVKYNPAVMGKNWLHLQDGSGDAAKGTNDITVTSMDQVTKGQTVTIKGTVKTMQDFGAGYRYAIIVENAKVVKP